MRCIEYCPIYFLIIIVRITADKIFLHLLQASSHPYIQEFLMSLPDDFTVALIAPRQWILTT